MHLAHSLIISTGFYNSRSNYELSFPFLALGATEPHKVRGRKNLRDDLVHLHSTPLIEVKTQTRILKSKDIFNELPCARGDTVELQGEEFCLFSKPQKLDVIQQNQRGVPEDKPCSVLTLSSQAELETLLPFSEILPSPTSLWILYIPNLHANRLAKVTLGNFLLYISGCRCMHKRWLQE